MRILVNTQVLLKDKLEGLGNFTFETLKRITAEHKEHEFYFVFDRQFNEEFIFSDNVHGIVLSPPSRHPILWYLRFEHLFPRLLKKYKADLFFSPDGWISLNTDIKTHTVIHDLNFETYPEYLPFTIRHYYKYFFPRFAEKANRIATVSKYSKNDIITKYNIPGDKIDVVYNGAGDIFKPLNAIETGDARKRFSDGKPYFLYAGSINPRKNIVNLLKAYDDFRIKNSSEIKLILAGKKMWWDETAESAFHNMKYSEDVIFTGRVSDSDLALLMGSAFAFIYISFFEGFGIPILEAMKCDVPVITSSETSMPEVAGDAALYTDPFSIDSISEAMAEIFKDQRLREKLISNAQNRKQIFSWDKTATLLWNSIEKIF